MIINIIIIITSISISLNLSVSLRSDLSNAAREHRKPAFKLVVVAWRQIHILDDHFPEATNILLGCDSSAMFCTKQNHDKILYAMLCRHEQLLWQHHHSNSVSLSHILSCHAIQASELCFGNQTRYLRAMRLHRYTVTCQQTHNCSRCYNFLETSLPQSFSYHCLCQGVVPQKPSLCFAKTCNLASYKYLLGRKKTAKSSVW